MTDHDRGAYTPQTDSPLAFDARQSRGGGGGPAPMTLIVSAIVLLLLIIALLLFYRSGVRGTGQAPQVVGAPVGQTKSAPPPESAAPAAGNGLQIYKSEVTPSYEGKQPNFTPAPEQPAPRPAPSAPVTSAPVTSAPAASAPVTAAPLRPAQTEPTAPPPPASHVAPNAPLAGPVTATSSAPPAVHPASSAHPAVAAKPAEAHPIAASSAPAAAKPAVKVAKAAGPTPKPVGPVAVPSAGEPLVQIGAFSSSALADKGWNDTAAVLPGRMAGKTEKVEQASRDGKTFYRTFVGGFGSKAEAVAFCEQLKAAKKSCMVR